MQSSVNVLARLIYAVKPLVPSTLWRLITAPYWWWYNRARHQLAGVGNFKRRRSVARLASLKNVHHGQRCFILGNGPSLQRTPLAPLADEITFGMNRIYLNFGEMGFETTYYLAVNTLVIEQCAAEIEQLKMPRFVTWRGRRWLQDDADMIYLDTDYTSPPAFAHDVRGRVFEGSTVTYVAMQLAYHMGFKEVVLVGVDHSFSTQGSPNTVVTSGGDDPDHFSPAYFGEGFRWQLPDLHASEKAYRLARRAYVEGGRRILDATIDGKLDIFPKIDYFDAIGSRESA